MAIRVTTNDLIRLNELVKIYYGNEINIYVMHGLMVSYLCSANTERFDTFLFNPGEHEPIIPMLEFEGDINKEFLPLFFGKLFNQIIEVSNKGKLVYPLISTDGFNLDFNPEALTSEQKRCLLDWYMGFFMGFMYLWKHDAIHYYIEQSDTDEGFLSGIITDRFVTALNTHYIVACNLITEVKPKYKNKDFKFILKKIKEAVSNISENQTMIIKTLLKSNAKRPYYLRATSEIIGIACDALKLIKSRGVLTSANDSVYTSH